MTTISLKDFREQELADSVGTQRTQWLVKEFDKEADSPASQNDIYKASYQIRRLSKRNAAAADALQREFEAAGELTRLEARWFAHRAKGL